MTHTNVRPQPGQSRSHDAGATAGLHLGQTACLLDRADQLGERAIAFNAGEERKLVLLEALIHSVLHLAEVIDIQQTIRREQ